jgi:uncharacterized protein YwgA
MNAQEFRLAILYRLISELEDAGKTRLQKLVYFLQEAIDVPTTYSFRMHHYGPYAEALETDIARLRLTGYIEIEPDSQGYGFHIKPIDSPFEEWSRLIEPYNEGIGRAIEVFGNRQTHELELAATIHFVDSLLADASTDKVLDKVKSLKPRFAESYIQDVHSELKSVGFLDDSKPETSLSRQT